MLAGRPSRTMLFPAVRRAAHQLLDAPLIFSDPVAVGLIPEADAETIRAQLVDHQTAESILLRSLFVLRSRFVEDRLAEAASRGVRQYVIFGAGLETFPWRQPKYARNMKIFVTDHVSSLVWSQIKFWERGLPKPANVTFVPLDLERDGIAARLAEFDFALDQPAFCSALGVTQYIGRAAVEELMQFAASLKRGSEIVFSYVPRADELAGPDRELASTSAQRAEVVGEAWKTRFSTSQLIEHLGTLCFSNVMHLTPENAQATYFGGRQDGLKAPVLEQLITAIV
jgi:methyltransferase (TIGR00027 family)